MFVSIYLFVCNGQILSPVRTVCTTQVYKGTILSPKGPKKMDAMRGEEEGRGAVTRRLGEFGEVMALCFGGYGEGSSDVHGLIDTLARSRVRKAQLQTGKAPEKNAVGAEVTLIQRRLSTAVIRANQSLLLSRLSHVGDGAGGASRRRQWIRKEEINMRRMREANWQVETSGKELVRKGMFWLR